MAIEIRDFTVTIPAGTTIASGFTSAMTFPPRTVTEIRVRVPPGPRGEVGFAVGTGGLNIIPYGAGTWIVTDDEDLDFPLTDTITSGAWQLLAYNTGSFPHTLRVYFYCELTPAPGSGSGGFTPLPAGSLDNTGAGAGTGAEGSGSGSSEPPVLPPVPVAPPSLTPPSLSPPVTLPPVFPSAPGPSVAEAPPIPESALIGVSDIGQVWLLGNGAYVQVQTQADVNALSGAGLPGVALDSAQHAALLAAYQLMETKAPAAGG